MKAANIQAGIGTLCALFGKSRQAWYDTTLRKDSKQMADGAVLNLIHSVRKNLPKIGGIKLYFLLRDHIGKLGIKMGRDGFFRLLRNNDMLVRSKRKSSLQLNHATH